MADEKLSEPQVLEYLAEHTDFLERNPAALDLLKVPHDTGGKSLIEYQVSVLQDQNRDLKHKLQHYHDVAAANEALLARIHSFHLALLQAGNPMDLLRAVDQRMREEFACDEVVLAIYELRGLPDHELVVSLKGRRERGLFAEFKKRPEPVCGRLRRDRLETLFGERAETVRSAAVAPLSHDGTLGFLALGSVDEHKFHPGMGTLFLTLLGQMLGHCLAQWMAAEEQTARALE